MYDQWDWPPEERENMPYRAKPSNCPECNESCQNKWHYPKKPFSWKPVIWFIGVPIAVGVAFHGTYLLATHEVKEEKCRETVLPSYAAEERQCKHSQHILTETSQNWICICDKERVKEFKK